MDRRARAEPAPHVNLDQEDRTGAALAAEHLARTREQESLHRLAELDRHKSEFISSISHELRTPLTSISGYLELLMDGEASSLTADQRQMLEIIDRNSRRLLALLDSLVTLSQLEAGTLTMRVAAVDVSVLIGRVRAGAADLLAASARRLDIDVDPGAGFLTGDVVELERALLNLVSNAVKFTGADGRISIDARPAADRVVITVSDDGLGIPYEDQAKLFSRFFRSRSAQDQAIQGTGLGLVIVKGIIDGHNGDVVVTSTPGAGTSVAVSLPRRGEVA